MRGAPKWLAVVSTCIAAQIIAVLSSSYEMCPVLYTENYTQEMESTYFAFKDAESCRY